MQSMRQVGRNLEMPNFTQALYDAPRTRDGPYAGRGRGRRRPRGLVGVRLQPGGRTAWGSHVIEFMAVATAVIPTNDDHIIEKPQLVLPLNG